MDATTVSATGSKPKMTAEGFPLFPRTPDGAHQRLDHHETVLSDLRDLFGEAPNPITGEQGRGIMAYLHRNEAELVRTREQQRIALEAQAKNDDRWRWRWTLIGIIATTCGVVVTIVHTLVTIGHPPTSAQR